MSALPEPHRLSLDDVRRMADAGILTAEDRVELINGVLVTLNPPPGPRHRNAVAWLNRHFARTTDHEVLVQDGIVVGGDFLVPDLLVAERLSRDDETTTALLAVEVSVTSHRHDHWKAERYASAGVGTYWIVDLPGRSVTVFDDLDAEGYRRTRRVGDGERLEPPVGATVDITTLLG